MQFIMCNGLINLELTQIYKINKAPALGGLPGMASCIPASRSWPVLRYLHRQQWRAAAITTVSLNTIVE